MTVMYIITLILTMTMSTAASTMLPNKPSRTLLTMAGLEVRSVMAFRFSVAAIARQLHWSQNQLKMQ